MCHDIFIIHHEPAAPPLDSSVTDAAASISDVCMLPAEGSTRDVLCRLRPQHSRSIFVLLLKLKGTSIQLVQGNK